MRERELPKSVRLTEAEAREVLLAELIETSPRAPTEADRKAAPSWTEADSAAATRDARHLAGERTDPAHLLPLRARLALARLKERGITGPAPHTVRAELPLLWATVALAYLAGVLTDRFTASGAVVNLLSPPLLAFLLWNLATYLLLAFRALRPGPTAPTLLRAALLRIFEKARLPAFGRGTLRRRFLERWTPLMAPKRLAAAARTLHWGAFAFAVGLITSLAVRGIGTAYVVGWESTWLSDRPEWVPALLTHTYGLIPGVGPMPDIGHIRLMNLAEGLAAPLADSGAWLLRLMGLITLTVLIPRALLALFAGWRIRRRERSLPYPVDTAYYRRILLTPEEALRREALLVAPDAPVWNETERRIRPVLEAAGFAVRRLTDDLWWAADDVRLAELRREGASERIVWLAASAAATPEEETHGALLASLGEAAVVLLDLSPLLRRFSPDAPNVRSRMALWETFVHAKGARMAAVDPRDADAAAEVLRAYVERTTPKSAAKA